MSRKTQRLTAIAFAIVVIIMFTMADIPIWLHPTDPLNWIIHP